MTIYHPNFFWRAFPRLKSNPGAFSVTSPIDGDYNCIAWAVGDDQNCWWPSDDTHWPESCPLSVTISAFKVAFATLGYRPCNNGRREHGYEKIVLYANNGEPTHAAKQLKNGRWTSKLGKYVDIEHRVKDLEGPDYGRVAMYFRRPALL